MADQVTVQNLQRVVQLCHQMLDLANCGDKFRKDGGCGIVFGLLRDSAYKIRSLAENELQAHGAAFEKTMAAEHGHRGHQKSKQPNKER